MGSHFCNLSKKKKTKYHSNNFKRMERIFRLYQKQKNVEKQNKSLAFILSASNFVFSLEIEPRE